MQWALWHSMLDLGNDLMSNKEITNKTERIKSLASKSALKKRFTEFGLSKIKSKKSYVKQDFSISERSKSH